MPEEIPNDQVDVPAPGEPAAIEAVPSEESDDSALSNHSSPRNHAQEQSSSESEEEEEGANMGAGVEEDGESTDSDESDQDYAAVLDRFAEILSLQQLQTGELQEKAPILPAFDLSAVAQHILQGKAKNIVVMCGAGISVSAGIPDFRSPGTGLYHRLQEYNLPHPQAVFEIDFFRRNPRPFYLLAKELFPGTFKPTPTHHFLKLLHDKGLLLRCYTQNIDSLEHQAGLPKEAVIAAHGNFDTARCITCKRLHSVEVVKESVFAQDPCYCSETKDCEGLVKPDIVFFGESLPERFWKSIPDDFAAADLLIVMGTSLVVHPFASLIDRVNENIPRLLINREMVGEAAPELRRMGYTKGFEFGPTAWRDVFHQGDCDQGVKELCEHLGWLEELEALIKGQDDEDDDPAVPAEDVNVKVVGLETKVAGVRLA